MNRSPLSLKEACRRSGGADATEPLNLQINGIDMFKDRVGIRAYKSFEKWKSSEAELFNSDQKSFTPL